MRNKEEVVVKVIYCKGVLSLWFIRKELVIEFRLPVYIWRTRGRDRRGGKDRRKKGGEKDGNGKIRQAGDRN